MKKLLMQLALTISVMALITALAVTGCGGGSSSSDSGSSAPLYSTGVLDTTFGGDGVVTTTIGTDSQANAVALQTDGKILAAGSASNSDFGLARYNTNGALDTTFDTDGVVTATFGNGGEAKAIALQTDGKIVVAGMSNGQVQSEFALARYNSDGSLDTAFDTDGIVTTTIGSGAGINAMVLQTDGKILAAGSGAGDGFWLARYTITGTLDTTFDTDGIVTPTFAGVPNAIALLTDGKILVTGWIYNGSDADFALVRYNSDGSFDTTFDTDGVVTTTFNAGSDSGANDMVLQTDGKILAAGFVYSGTNVSFALARYNSNGALDTTFDTDGLVTTTVISDSIINKIAIQSDNKIVAAGYASNGLNANFALARYNSNGSLDTAFDTDGILTTAIETNSFASAIALQPDNRIIAAGYISNGVNWSFALARYWR
ncbi:MAG: hypothetical protein HZA49_07265 [Planctomycetes bacterium]|nr:hypothetical protein [Planctomycetota bacterium]